jgi:DNA (cytosine-5)-methyltransferase 1
MKHGSLFSGIGGFDLAAEWMGWENVFHCEWMEFPRKVLDYHFPNADSHIDICKTDFKKYANKIDILTGGFPCQPFSLAGKRKGQDDERYLWGEMLRAIQEIKPKFVIAENVFGITNIDGGLVFQQVCLDLEGEGYEVQPFIVPACAKNAPHRRDRCWFIAQNTLFSGCIYRGDEQEGTEIREFGNTCTGSADGIHLPKGNVTNTNGNGFNECNGNDEINTSQRGEYALGHISKSNDNGNTSNTKSRRTGRLQNEEHKTRSSKSNELSGSKHSISNWNNFPSQPPICSGDDGLPSELDGITFSKWRAESIKGYGNAIVPQIAYQLFEIIQELNENN